MPVCNLYLFYIMYDGLEWEVVSKIRGGGVVEGWREEERKRGREGEMGRWEDGEMGRQGEGRDGETRRRERWGDGEIGRWREEGK